jgi:predicted GTPase
LVLSVVGPQSSGKSLLLNTLFGVNFLSSAGRCTRGVYGCLINIKNSAKYKQILLLDTEGINSAEANDDSYDKRVIFYALSVSHIVLICNLKDITKDMIDILRLAKDNIN